MKRNRQRIKQTPLAGASGSHSTIAVGPANRNRRWLFPLLALTVVPLFCLAVFEIALRAGGYGYPTRFFLPWNSSAQKLLVENEKFGWRFFPRHLARRPLPLSLSTEKPAGTFRIFVFGESAAMGDPEPAFGFSRILEVLLRERFPGTQFEVINVAFTAINSHVIRPIAQECARQNGDLWIVYMGNNEVMGPFGAGTIFSAQSPPLPVIRTSLALNTLKLGQWANQALDRITGAASRTQSWAGMEMFLQQQIRRDDPRLIRVYDHFRRNLDDMISLGVRSGAKVVVSTMASNLKDCAPLGSLHSADLNEARTAEWNTIYQSGSALEEAGQFAKAMDQYLAAERIDATYAELQFRLGRCFQAVTNQVEARRRFALALDHDTLRFRADSRLNSIIKEVSARHAGRGVHMLDAAESLARQASDGIPGDEFFFDHVHLNFEGNYLLAREVAEQCLSALPSEISRSDAGSWATAELAARRLALTGWNRFQMYESMQRRLSAAPFTNQLNDATRHQRYQTKLAELRPKLEPAALEQASGLFEEALSRSPNDPQLHENYAKLLNARGHLEAALTQFKRVAELWPHYTAAYYNLGSLLNSLGKASEAEHYFRRALGLNSDYGEAYNGLGSIAMNQGQLSQAAEYFLKAVQLRPALWEAHLNLGLALEKQGDSNRAMTSYMEALRLRSNSYLAHSRLGSLLAAQGDFMTAMKHYSDAARAQPESALAEFRDSVRSRPDDALAHFKLASAFAALDRRTEALESLRQAVRLKPDFWEAQYLIGVELATQAKLGEAQARFREVVRLRPNFALAHLNLGVALAKQSLLSDAAASFRETLRLQPTNQQAKQFLQALQSIPNASPQR